MDTIKLRSLINWRLLAVLCLGFSSGLPLALTSSTLQAWFTEAHVSLAAIGAISLIGIPYTLKFLWAPLMDYFNLPWLGRRRGWILATQFGLAIALMVMAEMHPESQAFGMYLLALVVAFLSASQDVSVDAYRTDILPSEERGLGSAYFVFAYRVALLIAGGLALIIADHVGWKWTYDFMACMLLLSAYATYKAPSVQAVKLNSISILDTVRAAVADLLQRDKISLILLLLITYKLGDALALQLMTNFLLHGLGFTLTEVGFAYKVMGFVATVLGVMLGGVILLRWNLFRALIIFGLAQAFSNFMFVILASAGKVYGLMMASIFIENFCSGLSTAAFLAFMMSLCDHRFTASQFALLSAIASLGRVLLGPVAAYLVAYLGWTQFYLWAFALSFPGIGILLLLKNEVLAYATVTTD